jgi:3-methylcrotonyl-CoA carboxylase beta subunit
MWPNARISVMGGEQAAGVLTTVERESKEARGIEWPAEEEQKLKVRRMKSKINLIVGQDS